jgi:hypothetical protein
MATSTSKDPAPKAGSSPARGTVAPEGDPALKKGEMTGKVRGPDVDTSFHTYEFTDPNTGEPVEWTPVVHDVATGVNSDGSLKTEKGDATFVHAPEGQDPTTGASGGEAGETTKPVPASTQKADK